MSRLLSFLKKKEGGVGGEDSPVSPPPSPKPKIDKVVESNNKSVKQMKRRKRDKLKKKVTDLIMQTDDDGSRRHSIDGEGEGVIDSNGNSMGPKGTTTSSSSVDGDSLRDVDSICEDERELSENAVHKNGKDGAGLEDAMDEAFEDLEGNFSSSRSKSPEDCSKAPNVNTKILSSDTVYSSCGPDQQSDCFDSAGEEYFTAQSAVDNQPNGHSNGEHKAINIKDVHECMPSADIVDAVNSAMIDTTIDENNLIPSIEISSSGSPEVCHYENINEFEKSSDDVTLSTSDGKQAHQNIREALCTTSSEPDVQNIYDSPVSPPELNNSCDAEEDQCSELDLSQSSIKSNSSSSSNRKNSSRSLQQSVILEDELVKIEDSKESLQAEARLAQRRAARAEARELRLRELERQQKENPDNGEDASDMSDGGSSSSRTPVRSSPSSRPALANNIVSPSTAQYRRPSQDSTNDDANKEMSELEEKFRGAMISNASLDNEKSQLTYQVEQLKDVRADITEQLTQLKKEHKKKCSEHEQLRKVYTKLQEESKMVRRVLEERDLLIQEYGLQVVGSNKEDSDSDSEDREDLLRDREETEDGLVLPRPVPMKRVLLTNEAAEILESGAAKGSLEWRLRRVVEHKRELEDELRRVNLELEEQLNSQRHNNSMDSNIQKEANKTVNEYKFKVQKAEAEASSLQANVTRLEALVSRYKIQSEELEKSEEELKGEKRRLQRELREAQSSLEELQTTNNHLLKRFDKLKNARSNLLKDLSQEPVT